MKKIVNLFYIFTKIVDYIDKDPKTKRVAFTTQSFI